MSIGHLQNLHPTLPRILPGLLLGALGGTALPAPGDQTRLAVELPGLPPPNPPVESRALAAPAGAELEGSGTSQLYSIGDPTDLEQLYLEAINRARANPALEAQRLASTTDPDVLNAYRYFGVDLDQMVSQIAALAPAPPLSPNARLLAAARLHSQDMLRNNFQGHTGSDGSSAGTRLTRQGYAWVRYGENVYAYAKGVVHGHSGFEVDWGFGPGGMQSPPGHRLNIHNRDFREAGIGVVAGTGGGVGPQLITQDFASQSGGTAFVTGVAYYDLNGNQEYDAGEGIGGIQVTLTGSSVAASTADSGGYSIPVSGNGLQVVTFSALGLPPSQRSVELAQNQNVKVDFVPVYAPPTIAGLAPSGSGSMPRYQFSPVAAATAYQWKSSRREPYARIEDAEEGLGQMLPATSSDYPVVVSDLKATGTSSFHLAHTQPSDQQLTLNVVLRPGSASRLTFASRLGYATATQVARTQISTNGGQGWLDLWHQAGSGGSGQSSFTRITNSLSPFAGQEVILRFLYDFAGGSYYVGSDRGLGWYLDDLNISDAEELADTVIAEAGDGLGFEFAPARAGDYLLRVRALVGGRWLGWGPPYLASTLLPSAPLVRIAGPPVLSADHVQFEFETASGAGSLFDVETAPDPVGPWAADVSASLETIVPGARTRVRCARGGRPINFYRVVAR